MEGDRSTPPHTQKKLVSIEDISSPEIEFRSNRTPGIACWTLCEPVLNLKSEGHQSTLCRHFPCDVSTSGGQCETKNCAVSVDGRGAACLPFPQRLFRQRELLTPLDGHRRFELSGGWGTQGTPLQPGSSLHHSKWCDVPRRGLCSRRRLRRDQPLGAVPYRLPGLDPQQL